MPFFPPFSFPLGDHVGRGWAIGAGLKGTIGVGVGVGCVVFAGVDHVGGVGGHVQVGCGGCQDVDGAGHCVQVVDPVEGEDVRYRRPFPGGDHFC